MVRKALLAMGGVVLLSSGHTPVAPAQTERPFLNVSYDPTRELYQEVDAAFTKH
jgi:ABC-type sulfate transport system substrate-binding protein